MPAMKRTSTSLESPRGAWDKATIIAALRARRDKGLGTGMGAIQRSQPGLSSAIYRLFGSHNHARASAGVDPERRGRPPTWDPSAVLAGLRRRYTSGKPLSSTLMRQQDPSLISAAVRLFGSYREALGAAGIDPEPANSPGRSTWPTQRILDGLRDYYARWWRTHSRDDPPRPRLIGADPELVSAARSRFGGVFMALRAAGIDDPIITPHLLWPPDKILAALRKASRDGTLSYRMCSRGDSRLANAARRQFGSLSNAALAAGLRYVRAPHRRLRKRGQKT